MQVILTSTISLLEMSIKKQTLRLPLDAYLFSRYAMGTLADLTFVKPLLLFLVN